MCGICGIVDLKGEGRVSNDIVDRMIQKLSHRGPDGIGSYVKENVAFGFSRLSIVDLEGGMQPLTNEDGSIVLLCNGEIFNYKELKQNLLLKGHRFKTNTDIEVILHLYEENGENFLNKLNGQFAFVIYDAKKKLLFCARDHVGIAPFFYTITDNILIFASEIKAILEHPSVKREVDLVALDQMLTFPGVISPRTMFKNIRSLENAHYLMACLNGRISVLPYWDLIYPKQNELDYDLKDEGYYIEKLDELITKSVEYRLQADVPVGFYLSGGLDSSIISSKINNKSNIQKRHSFSIGFEDKGFSESKYQKMMADYVGSIHHEKMFFAKDVESRLRRVVYHCETPLKETYNTASMALSKLAREQGIKVILTGEGADELFAGYVGYKFDKLRRMRLRNSSSKDDLEQKLRERIWGDEDFFYEKDYGAFAGTKRDLYSKSINNNYDVINCLNHEVIKKERLSGIDLLHKRSYVDFKLRLPEHLLADHGDRMAYANSIEARYPFLDKDVIEFARLIPPELKLKDFDEKYILKRVARGKIPDEIIKRPKFAFVAPGSPQLLKQNIEFIEDILSYERIKKEGYFNPDTVERLKKQYKDEKFKLNLPFDNDMLIIVITFGLFLEEFNIGN